MEAQAHPLIMAIPRFIQLVVPLPPLKPMGQSRRGATQIEGAQVRLLVVAIHTLIDPSALRAVKAFIVE
jgi:hypothetical protein